MGAHVVSVLYPVVMGVMWGAHVMSVLHPVVMGVIWGHMLCLYCTLW